MHGLPGVLDVGEIQHPAEQGVERAANVHFDVKCVPM